MCAVRRKSVAVSETSNVVALAQRSDAVVRKISTDGRLIDREPVRRMQQKQTPLQSMPGTLTLSLPVYAASQNERRSMFGLMSLIVVVTLAAACVLSALGLVS